MKKQKGKRNGKTGKAFFFPLSIIVIFVIMGCTAAEPGNVSLPVSISETVQAKPEAGRVLEPDADLFQILSYAALKNPGLKSSFYRWRAAQERIPAAGALPDPQLSYTHFLREVETKVGPQEGKVSVSQMIPSLGTLSLKEDVAALKADVLKSEFDKTKAELFHEIRVLYFEFYYHIRAVKLVKENLLRLVSFKPVVETAYKTAKVPYAQLLRVQIAIDKEKEKIASLEDSLLNIKNRMNAVLDRPADAGLPDPVLPGTFTAEAEEINGEKIELFLKKYNPELIILDRRIAMETKALELAAHKDAPNFMVGAGWIITGRTDAMMVEDPGKDPVTVMFGLSIPLYRGKYRAMENSQRESLRSFEKMRHDMKNILMSKAQIVMRDVKAAERRISLFQKNLVEKAEQTFRVSQTAFQGGKADFLDMLDAINLIIELQLKAEKAVMMKAKHISKLNRLFGNRISFLREE